MSVTPKPAGIKLFCNACKGCKAPMVDAANAAGYWLREPPGGPAEADLTAAAAKHIEPQPERVKRLLRLLLTKHRAGAVNGEISATYEEIRAATGMTRKTIALAIKDGKAAGLLKVRRKADNHRGYGAGPANLYGLGWLPVPKPQHKAPVKRELGGELGGGDGNLVGQKPLKSLDPDLVVRTGAHLPLSGDRSPGGPRQGKSPYPESTDCSPVSTSPGGSALSIDPGPDRIKIPGGGVFDLDWFAAQMSPEGESDLISIAADGVAPWAARLRLRWIPGYGLGDRDEKGWWTLTEKGWELVRAVLRRREKVDLTASEGNDDGRGAEVRGAGSGFGGASGGEGLGRGGGDAGSGP
jgi:hypothetical protein